MKNALKKDMTHQKQKILKKVIMMKMTNYLDLKIV